MVVQQKHQKLSANIKTDFFIGIKLKSLYHQNKREKFRQKLKSHYKYYFYATPLPWKGLHIFLQKY